jgi:hypothetical protein
MGARLTDWGKMSIAMDGTDKSAGCTCEVGLDKTQLAFLEEELTKWMNEKHLTHQSDEWRRGFKDGMRIALANILKLTMDRE